MTAPPSASSPKSLFTLPIQALRDEHEKLQTTRTEITLVAGQFTGAFAGYFMYQFEVPEDLQLRGVDHVACLIGQLQPIGIDGRIVSLENQYITVALPRDFGAVLPEINCQWNYDEQIPFITDLLAGVASTHTVASLLLDPGRPENNLNSDSEPVTDRSALHEQSEALKKILQNRLSYLWGPSRTGKTHTLVLAALNHLKAGRSVLIAVPTAHAADEILQKILHLNKELAVRIDGVVSRVGLPADPAALEHASFSFEYEVEAQRADKKKRLEESVSLLRAYWKTKVHQYLYEDFYARLSDMRERTNENRKQLEKVRDEITALKEIVTRSQNASMLKKFMKGFSKEEAAAAQKQLNEKLLAQKKLQPIQQALNAELMRMEAQTPIETNEMKEYQAAVMRIGELGGIQKLAADVERQSAVDEASLLASKRCIITTINGFFEDQRLRSLRYDVVLIDDAARVNPPYLAALSAVARESMLIAGDPFQLGPDSLSRSDIAYAWMQQDIFLMLAQTEHLDDLFEWAKKNPRWSLPLTSHFAGAPKLSRFLVSFFLADRVHMQDRPGSRGSLVVLDTGDLKSTCRQYLGKKSLVPYNDAQTKRTVDVVKHVLARGQRVASEIGVIVPLQGTSLYTKLQLRLHGIRNVEVGTPALFQGRSKKTIVLDLTMAGVDYTMRPLDDRKIGEHKLMRGLNTILSCVEEDLYVVADVGHFKSVYKDRLISKFLLQLQAQSEVAPALAASAKAYDEMSWDKRAHLFGARLGRSGTATDHRATETGIDQQRDVETELRMKMIARQQPAMVITGKDFEQETFFAAHRVLALRMDANLLSQMISGELLFRHSLGTEQAAARLPLDSCRNEEEFRKTMERWNLLIYEMSGAGETDIMFFAKQTPQARVRWDINNLRAFYSSAVEAIIDESKHRIASAVTKVFQECLGKPQPANPLEWSTAYLNFLGKIEAYLAWISEQLRR